MSNKYKEEIVVERVVPSIVNSGVSEKHGKPGNPLMSNPQKGYKRPESPIKYNNNKKKSTKSNFQGGVEYWIETEGGKESERSRKTGKIYMGRGTSTPIPPPSVSPTYKTYYYPTPLGKERARTPSKKDLLQELRILRKLKVNNRAISKYTFLQGIRQSTPSQRTPPYTRQSPYVLPLRKLQMYNVGITGLYPGSERGGLGQGNQGNQGNIYKDQGNIYKYKDQGNIYKYKDERNIPENLNIYKDPNAFISPPGEEKRVSTAINTSINIPQRGYFFIGDTQLREEGDICVRGKKDRGMYSEDYDDFNLGSPCPHKVPATIDYMGNRTPAKKEGRKSIKAIKCIKSSSSGITRVPGRVCKVMTPQKESSAYCGFALHSSFGFVGGGGMVTTSSKEHLNKLEADAEVTGAGEDTRDSRDIRDSRDSRDSRETRDSRDSRDNIPISNPLRRGQTAGSKGTREEDPDQCPPYGTDISSNYPANNSSLSFPKRDSFMKCSSSNKSKHPIKISKSFDNSACPSEIISSRGGGSRDFSGGPGPVSQAPRGEEVNVSYTKVDIRRHHNAVVVLPKQVLKKRTRTYGSPPSIRRNFYRYPNTKNIYKGANSTNSMMGDPNVNWRKHTNTNSFSLPNNTNTDTDTGIGIGAGIGTGATGSSPQIAKLSISSSKKKLNKRDKLGVQLDRLRAQNIILEPTHDQGKITFYEQKLLNEYANTCNTITQNNEEIAEKEIRSEDIKNEGINDNKSGINDNNGIKNNRVINYKRIASNPQDSMENNNSNVIPPPKAEELHESLSQLYIRDRKYWMCASSPLSRGERKSMTPGIGESHKRLKGVPTEHIPQVIEGGKKTIKVFLLGHNQGEGEEVLDPAIDDQIALPTQHSLHSQIPASLSRPNTTTIPNRFKNT